MLNLLKRFSGAYRRYFFIGPLAKLVEACFDLITPLVVASMIDNGVGARDMGWCWWRWPWWASRSPWFAKRWPR